MSGWSDVAALGLACTGSLLMLVASVGLLRMPDLLTRMHASSKAGTLGAALVLAGVALRSGRVSVVLEVLLIVLFLFLTAPVAAHMIARAAYCSGVRLSAETVVDELAERGDASAGSTPGTAEPSGSDFAVDNGEERGG
jgi:multicomponent Na+:H+ antiporter subunit G